MTHAADTSSKTLFVSSFDLSLSSNDCLATCLCLAQKTSLPSVAEGQSHTVILEESTRSFETEIIYSLIVLDNAINVNIAYCEERNLVLDVIHCECDFCVDSK